MAGEIEVIAPFKRKDQVENGPVLPLLTIEQVAGATGFTPVSPDELAQGAVQVAGLPLRAAIILLANAGRGTVIPTGAPAITRFAPTRGIPGSVLVITGTNFTGATVVTVNGLDVEGFLVDSDTQITATLAPLQTSGLVRVTTAGGEATSSSPFIINVPATITSVTPNSGVAGASFTIGGTNFTGATAVTVNGVAVQGFTVVSATQITVTTADGQTTGLVRVTTAAGIATSATAYTITVPTVLPKVPVLMISGQSNAEGKGEKAALDIAPLSTVSPDPRRELQRTKIWNPTAGAWQKLQVGVNELGPPLDGTSIYNQYFGAEIGLGQAWEDENLAGTLYIIKSAHSGQALSAWSKENGGLDYTALVTTSTNALNALVAQGLMPDIKGIYWMQGETDRPVPALVAVYATELGKLFENLEADGVLPATALRVIGQVNDSVSLQAQQQLYVDTHANARLIVTNQYYRPDGLHYGAREQFCNGDSFVYNALFGTSRHYRFPAFQNLRVIQPGEEWADVNSPFWYFEPGWNLSPGEGNAAVYNSTGGHAFTQLDKFAGLSFTGTGFAIDLPRSSGLSMKFDVYVNDAFTSTIDLPGGVVEYCQERYQLTLPNGTYSVKIVARESYNAMTGNTYGWIDRLRVTGRVIAYQGGLNNPTVVGLPITTYEEDDIKFYRSGPWEDTVGPGGAGMIRLNVTDTGFVGFTFNGTGVALDLPTPPAGSNYGLDVYVNDVFRQAIVIAGSGTGLPTSEVFGIAGLPVANHTVKALFRGQTQFGVFDRARITGTLIAYQGGPNDPRDGTQYETLIDDRDSLWVFRDASNNVITWHRATAVGHYQETFTFHDGENTTASIELTGISSFSFDTVAVGFQTKFDLKLNGNFLATLDYQAGQGADSIRERFTHSGLNPANTYTLTVVSKFGTYGARAIIDRLRTRP